MKRPAEHRTSFIVQTLRGWDSLSPARMTVDSSVFKIQTTQLDPCRGVCCLLWRVYTFRKLTACGGWFPVCQHPRQIKDAERWPTVSWCSPLHSLRVSKVDSVSFSLLGPLRTASTTRYSDRPHTTQPPRHPIYATHSKSAPAGTLCGPT